MAIVSSDMRVRGAKFLQSDGYELTVMTLTTFILFMDDIRVAVCPKNADPVFNIIHTLLFVVFMLELLLLCVCQEKYFELKKFPFLRSFFWLDLLAAVSLIFHIQWLDPTASGNNEGGKHAEAIVQAKLVRFVRIVRVIRIAKIFDQCQRRKKRKIVDKSVDQKEKAVHKQSNVARHLSEVTTRKVVVMVLVMLLVVPILNQISEEKDASYDYMLKELNRIANYEETTEAVWDDSVAWTLNHFEARNTPVITLTVTGSFWETTYAGDDFDIYRNSEMKHATIIGKTKNEAYFSFKAQREKEALYDIATTLTVMGLLSILTFMFNSTTQKLVIEPIERMLFNIELLKNDPLRKATVNVRGRKKQNETGILERTLAQLTTLLQVGFGEAGSRMIRKCMDDDSDDLNPLVDGTKVIAMYGFCDIRRFTDATECLKEDVMMYVNEIADIVHGEARKMDGYPNKNIGDAFLIVWRLPEKCTQNHIAIKSANGPESKVDARDAILYNAIMQTADKALMAFIRTIVEVHASETLAKFASHQGILKTYGRGWNTTLGFGLHVGWSIEGPIGSRYKIDATYLSAHVNMSETLESTTKKYGPPLLMSGEFHNLLCPWLKERCRTIDYIMVSGRNDVLSLHTFDIHDVSLDNLVTKTKARQYMKKNASQKVNSELSSTGSIEPTRRHSSIEPGGGVPLEGQSNAASQYLVRGENVWCLQGLIPPDFYKHWNLGMHQYKAGNWQKAELHFKNGKQLWPEDKPSDAILSYMKQFNFSAPKDWKGYRDES